MEVELRAFEALRLVGLDEICITSRRLIYRVDRKDVLRLPVCLRCARMC